MELISREVLELEARCDRYIVIKDRDKQGSAVMGFTGEQDEHFRDILSRCDLIASSPLQVVRLGGRHCLEVYSEYAPYTIIEDERQLLDIAITGNCPGRKHPLLEVRKRQLGY